MKARFTSLLAIGFAVLAPVVHHAEAAPFSFPADYSATVSSFDGCGFPGAQPFVAEQTCGGDEPGEVTTYTVAKADLRTGTLRVLARNSLQTTSQFRDTITIHGPGDFTPIPVTARLQVHGIVDTTTAGEFGDTSLGQYVGDSGPDVVMNLGLFGPAFASSVGNCFFISGECSNSTNNGDILVDYDVGPVPFGPDQVRTFRATLTATATVFAEQSLNLIAELNLRSLARAPVLCVPSCEGTIRVPFALDFGNTAALSFELPDGVTFTSASGVLLTEAPVTSVPSGSSSMIMFAGFLAVALVTWRRSTGQFGLRPTH